MKIDIWHIPLVVENVLVFLDLWDMQNVLQIMDEPSSQYATLLQKVADRDQIFHRVLPQIPNRERLGSFVTEPVERIVTRVRRSHATVNEKMMVYTRVYNFVERVDVDPKRDRLHSMYHLALEILKDAPSPREVRAIFHHVLHYGPSVCLCQYRKFVPIHYP